MHGPDAARVARSPHAAVVRKSVRAICAPPAVGPAHFSMMAAGKFIDREANPKPPDRLARAIGVWCFERTDALVRCVLGRGSIASLRSWRCWTPLRSVEQPKAPVGDSDRC